MKIIHPRQMGDWQPYVFYDKPPFNFSPSECDAIIHLSKSLKPDPASTAGSPGPADPAIRVSEVRWLKQKKDARWIFERLTSTIQNIQQNWYPFNLSGYLEPAQVTRYLGSEGGHYEEHRDFGAGGMSTRKLSVVVLLSNPKDFEGGNLEILAKYGADKTASEMVQGTIVAFPSWELHRVTRVTSGERWSLVCWVHGEPFR